MNIYRFLYAFLKLHLIHYFYLCFFCRVNEDILLFDSIDDWLEAIKMDRYGYTELFHKSGVNSMDAVIRLTVQDLAAIGITLVGHQRKIINSIQTIRTHLSHGFLV